MKRLRKTISLFFRFLLLLIFIGYGSSITMFYHTHVVNGYKITHSHPFRSTQGKDKPVNKHSHSTSEYLTIQQLNIISSTNSFYSPELPVPVAHQVERAVRFYSAVLLSNCSSSAQLRAPPCC
jgi:hypothetical protein